MGAAKLAELKKGMWNHGQYEEQRYCSVPGYSCVDHKMKHYKFWVILDDLQAPINCEQINWAKNWLAQHIAFASPLQLSLLVNSMTRSPVELLGNEESQILLGGFTLLIILLLYLGAAL